MGIGLAGMFLTSCSERRDEVSVPDKVVAEKPFVSGGDIDVQLDAGSYTVRPSSDNQIRVWIGGDPGNAVAEVSVEGTRAKVTVKDPPKRNFHARIEVPALSNLVVNVTAGDFDLSGIAGGKDITSVAGNVTIAVGDPNDYATAEGSVKAGNIDAPMFGSTGSGVGQRFSWKGPGKYALRANLTAGNLTLKR